MNQLFIHKYCIKLWFLTLVLLLFGGIANSQPALPQRSLTATATQAIHFGTLCVLGSGGTVTVGYDGSRTATGDIVLLAEAPFAQPAIFEVKLCQGRNVVITFSPTTLLTGSNGGSLTLNIGPTEKGISGIGFLTGTHCDYVNVLRVGGTLVVPGTAIGGTYSGSFDITFNQE